MWGDKSLQAPFLRVGSKGSLTLDATQQTCIFEIQQKTRKKNQELYSEIWQYTYSIIGIYLFDNEKHNREMDERKHPLLLHKKVTSESVRNNRGIIFTDIASMYYNTRLFNRIQHEV